MQKENLKDDNIHLSLWPFSELAMVKAHLKTIWVFFSIEILLWLLIKYIVLISFVQFEFPGNSTWQIYVGSFPQKLIIYRAHTRRDIWRICF